MEWIGPMYPPSPQCNLIQTHASVISVLCDTSRVPSNYHASLPYFNMRWTERNCSCSLTASLPLLKSSVATDSQVLTTSFNFESHSSHTPVKTGQSNMPLALVQPLPSAPAVSNFISFTSSFTKGVCVYKTPGKRDTYHVGGVQSCSRVIRAWQWKMKARCKTGAVKHVSGWCSHRCVDGQVEGEKEHKYEQQMGRTGG